MNTSKTKDKYQLAIVPGDGIGKEVMEATLYVLDALDIDFDYVYGEAGDECLEKTGNALPNETLDIIKNADVFIGLSAPNLLDEEMCQIAENKFGKITNKYVLYRGNDTITDFGVEYLNVSNFLRSL